MIDIAEFYQLYEWAENQALVKNESNDENFNKNDAIKAEMTPFFKLMKFKKMGPLFLIEYVVKKGFLFSHGELSNILGIIHGDVKVKITNSDGSSIYGYLRNKSAIEIIENLKNRESDNHDNYFIYWKTKCKEPSTPCPLKWKAGVK
uniref:Uncharacterized protein n=1 Tax=Panagrolaimus davidi TaxID=227884 RepID=A0A914PWC9_9BILA